MRKLALSILAFLVLSGAGLAALVFLGLEPIINDYRAHMAALVGEYLGRPVELGPVQLTWKNGVGILLKDARLQGKEGDGRSQVTLGSAFLQFDAWKAIRSRGRKLEVHTVTLESPVVLAMRRADGTWDFDDVQQHLANRARQQAPMTTEEADSLLQGLRIASVIINNGRVKIDDRQLVSVCPGISVSMCSK